VTAPTTRERFEGAIVGLAVGDAIGYPCEFRTRPKILAAFPPNGVTGFVAGHDPRWPAVPMIIGKEHAPGTYSDDTQMSLAIAEALVDARGDGLEAIMEAMSRRFVAWSRSEENDRAPGSTCMTGCAALGRGVPWRDAGVKESKGAGAPMRAVPIGLRFHGNREKLLEVARASSIPTHGHDAAIEGTAAVALAAAMCLHGESPAAIYDAIMEECAPRSADFARCLEKLPRLLDAPPEVALSEEGLGESWISEEAVASALYCLTRTPDDFRTAVLVASNTDGDSDTIACIVGGLSGARNGVEAIPREWREGVENAAMLVDVARRLHDLTRA
jgi:ADP-ribosylglycohydrolase